MLRLLIAVLLILGSNQAAYCSEEAEELKPKREALHKNYLKLPEGHEGCPLLELPNDVLVPLFSDYLEVHDVLQLDSTCIRLRDIFKRTARGHFIASTIAPVLQSPTSPNYVSIEYATRYFGLDTAEGEPWLKANYGSIPTLLRCGRFRRMFDELFAQARLMITSSPKNLQELEITTFCVKAIPSEIMDLEELTKLRISFGDRVALPINFGTHPCLNEILITSKILPPQIGGLMGLNKLDASNSAIVQIPLLCLAANLVRLDLSANSLKELPPEIGYLGKLEDLDVSDNRLTRLPRTIGDLTSLKNLDFEWNEIEELPAEIGRLTQLVSLKARSNLLINLPVQIAVLKLTQGGYFRNDLKLPSNDVLCTYLDKYRGKSGVPNFAVRFDAEDLSRRMTMGQNSSVERPPAGALLFCPDLSVSDLLQILRTIDWHAVLLSAWVKLVSDNCPRMEPRVHSTYKTRIRTSYML